MNDKMQDAAGLLVSAKLTAFWLEEMIEKTKSAPTGCVEFDREVDRMLSCAAIAILRWRIVTGEKAGLLRIKDVGEIVADEFD